MTRSRRWFLATALVVIIVLALGWFGFISPQRSHKSRLQAQAVSVEQQNAALQTQVNKLQRQAKNKIAEQAEIQAIGREIPGSVQMAPYMRELAKAALATGVDLQSIAPSGPQNTKLVAPAASANPNPTAAAGSNPPAATGSNQVLVIGVKLSIAGSYFQVQQFLANVEKLERFSQITSINLAPGGVRTGDSTAEDQSSTWRTLKGSISLDIFMNPLLGDAPTPAPTPSK